MCPLSCSSLWLLFQCSQRCSHMFITSFSTQLKQHNNPQLTASLSGLHLWHFLSCTWKHLFVFSRPPLQKRFDLYPSLWCVAGTRWWLSRRPSWLPPVQQMTTITPSTPWWHTSCCASSTAWWHPQRHWYGQQVIHKRLLQHPVLWCLNNQTSAGENENKKFNSSLLIHSTLVIFQLLLVCRGLSIF